MAEDTIVGSGTYAATATSKPVFIVGMNGSGTTMMLNCLNAHHDLYGFPRETLVIPHYISRLPNYGNLSDPERFQSLWNDFRSESYFRWVNDGEVPPLPENWRELPRTLSTVIDETFGFFARKHGKQRWCEKTPMHVQHINALHEVFPDAYFIHMIRDGRSCAASFHRRWKYIPERTIYRWRNVISEAREQANACGARYIEVFYERLTADPLVEMRRVCDFIDVEFDEIVLSPSRKPEHSGSTFDTIVQSVPRWHNYFDERKLRTLERIAGNTLAELGYEVGQEKSNHDPSKLALQFWAARDHLRRAIRVIWQQLTTPKDKRWDGLGGRIRRAILQNLSSKF